MSFFPEVITYSKKNQITYDDGGVATIDGTVGNAFELTVDGTSVTIAHNNTPQDVEYEFRLSLNWVSGSITFPSEWTTGQSAPTGTGYYVITGRTVDSGASWDIQVGGDAAPSPSAYGLAGVDFQVTNTKPTTRSDSSALVAGDHWYKPDERTEWFWNGTYWLSNSYYQAAAQGINTTSFVSAPPITPTVKYNIFLESIHWSGKVGTSNDASNYRSLRLYSYNNNAANTTILSSISTTQTYTPGTYFALDIGVNYLFATDSSVFDSATPTFQTLYVQDLQTGAPGNIYCSISAIYRYAAK